MSEWSEGFARTIAEKEGISLTDEHWEVIWYIRKFYDEHQVQAQVLEMIKHFKKKWGKERGNNKYLHKLFPTGGGPQKQGNRIAGIRRTKGEH
jgi:tRNA 2-thiouridine synthesizing protein E